MFKVKGKNTGQIYTVYGIQEEDDVPYFLMYSQGSWKWYPASNYTPAT